MFRVMRAFVMPASPNYLLRPSQIPSDRRHKAGSEVHQGVPVGVVWDEIFVEGLPKGGMNYVSGDSTGVVWEPH